MASTARPSNKVTHMEFKCAECGGDKARTFAVQIPIPDKPGMFPARFEQAVECLKCGRVEIDNSRRGNG